MAKPSLGAPAPAPFFTPASDQTTVSHLKVTVQFATPKPDGRLQLTVFQRECLLRSRYRRLTWSP